MPRFTCKKKLQPKSVATYRGMCHSVLNDISRSRANGPRPFAWDEFYKRFQEKATGLGQKLGKHWKTFAYNMVLEAFRARLVNLHTGNRIAVTREGRDKYRLTRRICRMRTGNRRAPPVELAQQLDKAVGPIARQSKGDLLAQIHELEQKCMPTRGPPQLQSWNTLSTISDCGTESQADDPGDEDMSAPPTPRAVPRAMPEVPEEVPALDAAAHAYPTPDSAERVRHDLDARPDPETPTRDPHRSTPQPGLEHGPHWEPTVIEGDEEYARELAERHRMLSCTRSQSPTALSDYVHPTIAALQDRVEELVRELEEAQAKYARDAELFDAHRRAPALMGEAHPYMLACNLAKATDKVGILNKELDDLRGKYAALCSANDKLREHLRDLQAALEEHEVALDVERARNTNLTASVADFERRSLGRTPSQALLAQRQDKERSDEQVRVLEQELAAVQEKYERARRQLDEQAEEDRRVCEEMERRARRRLEALKEISDA